MDAIHPNSFDNCGTACPMEKLGVPTQPDSTAYQVLYDETNEVWIALHNLHHGTMHTTESKSRDFKARQRLAARGCALIIFEGQCPRFEAPAAANQYGWELVEKNIEQTA